MTCAVLVFKRELGDGEVTGGHGLMELSRGDAVRLGPGEPKWGKGAGGQARCPPNGFVDAALAQERVGGAHERFRFGGQDPPAEALVLLALGAGDGRDVGVREMRGEPVRVWKIQRWACAASGLWFERSRRCRSCQVAGSMKCEQAVNRARRCA